MDEWQNFATDSFAEILSESRKYRMGLVCANQFKEQLPERTWYAVLWAVGTIQSPFSMTTVLPKQQSLFEGHREKIVRVSRERYARQRYKVEEKIQRWIGIIHVPLPAH